VNSDIIGISGVSLVRLTRLTGVLILMTSAAVFAQQDGGTNLRALQNLSQAASAQQQAQIQQWIKDSLDGLADAVVKLRTSEAADEEQTLPDLGAIRERIAKAGQGSEDFITAFDAVLGQQVLQRIAEAEPTLAVNLTMVLAEMRHRGLGDTLCTLCGNSSEVVRYWAVNGLMLLRDDLFGGDARLATQVVESLVQLSGREHVVMILELVYRTLDVPGNQLANQSVCRILEGRLNDYKKGSIKAIGADVLAVAGCQRFYANASETDKKRIMMILGRLFGVTVGQYCNDSPVPPVKYYLEKLILQIERSLGSITGVNNLAVSQAIMQANNERAVEQLAAWIGSPSSEGVLNKPPYSIPVSQLTGQQTVAE